MPASAPDPESTPESARVGIPIPRHDRFADGTVKASGFELAGALHGHWEWFRVDGTLMRSGQFHLGEQVGTWRTWDRAGRIVKETEFHAAPPEAPAGEAATEPGPEPEPEPATVTQPPADPDPR